MTSFDLLKYIEEQGKMGPENLEYIIEAFTDIGRNDLAKKVREFGNKHKHSKPGLYCLVLKVFTILW